MTWQASAASITKNMVLKVEAEDISRLFRNEHMDKSLVGKEKTEYFKQLNKVLKNPDDYPDAIREIQNNLA